MFRTDFWENKSSFFFVCDTTEPQQQKKEVALVFSKTLRHWLALTFERTKFVTFFFVRNNRTTTAEVFVFYRWKWTLSLKKKQTLRMLKTCGSSQSPFHFQMSRFWKKNISSDCPKHVSRCSEHSKCTPFFFRWNWNLKPNLVSPWCLSIEIASP